MEQLQHYLREAGGGGSGFPNHGVAVAESGLAVLYAHAGRLGARDFTWSRVRPLPVKLHPKLHGARVGLHIRNLSELAAELV